MRLLKNALLSSALALSVAHADGAELNQAATSLAEPAHGMLLSGNTTLPPLPDATTTYANINNPDTPLTFEQIKNNLPGVFFNMADGAPRPETLVIIHKQEGLPITGGAGDADKIRDFLWRQPGLKDLMGSRSELRNYIDNTVSLIQPDAAYSEFNPILAIPYSAFRLKYPEQERVINMVNLSNEEGIHHHLAGVPGYTSMTPIAQSYYRHFTHAHEFAHTHQISINLGFHPLSRLKSENYADTYAVLDTFSKMYENGIPESERDQLLKNIIELRNTNGLMTLRSDDKKSYHAHDSDIAVLAAATLFKENPDMLSTMSDKDKMALSYDIASEVTKSARADYKVGNRTAFANLTAMERESLAKTVMDTISEKYSLSSTRQPSMPEVMQEDIPNLTELGFTHLTSHNPNNPVDPGRTYYREGNDSRPYMLVENHLLHDSGNIISSLEMNKDSLTLYEKVVDTSIEGELPKERTAFVQNIRDAFMEQGLEAPTIISDSAIEDHMHLTLVMPAAFDDKTTLPRVEAALKQICEHPDVTPSMSPTATKLTMNLLDNSRHLDNSLLHDPEMLLEASRVLFPDEKQITFSSADKGAPKSAYESMPGPPLSVLVEARAFREEEKEAKRDIIDKMRPRP